MAFSAIEGKDGEFLMLEPWARSDLNICSWTMQDIIYLARWSPSCSYFVIFVKLERAGFQSIKVVSE